MNGTPSPTFRPWWRPALSLAGAVLAIGAFAPVAHAYGTGAPPHAYAQQLPHLAAGDPEASVKRVSELLHEVADLHHRYFRIVDGADDDWASWYAEWLVAHSELPALLGSKPARSELIRLLVSAAKEYGRHKPSQSWESYYAQKIIERFRH